MAQIAEAVEMQVSLTGVKEASAQYTQFSEASENHTKELNDAFKSLVASTQLLDTKLKAVASDSGPKVGTTLQAATVHAKNAKKGVEDLGDSGHHLDALREHVELVNGHLKTFTNFANLAGAAVLEIAGAEFLKDQVVELAEYGEQISRAAAKTGLSTDALQEWNYAAKVSGASLDALLPGFRILTKNAVEAAGGHGQLTEVFKSLNVELKDADGHLKSTSAISNEFITALAGVKDKAQQVAIAQLAMGRSATEFLPILEQGSEGLAKMREEAHALGLVLGGESIENAALMREEMTKLKLVMEATKFQAVLAFLGPLTDTLQALTGALVAEQDIWRSTNQATDESAHSLGVWGTVVMGVVDTVEIFSVMLRQAEVGYQMLAELLGTAGASALETTIYYWDELSAVIGATVETVELAWKALSHPSEAKEAVQEIGKVWQDEQKKIADLDKEHNRTEKVYWDSFREGVDAHVNDLDNAASAVDKSLQAIRSAMQNPIKSPKTEGGESGEDVEDAKARKQALLELQKELSDSKAKILDDGLDKERAIENAKFNQRLAAFKDDNEKLKLAKEIHIANMAALTQKAAQEEIDAEFKARQTFAADEAANDKLHRTRADRLAKEDEDDYNKKITAKQFFRLQDADLQNDDYEKQRIQLEASFLEQREATIKNMGLLGKTHIEVQARLTALDKKEAQARKNVDLDEFLSRSKYATELASNLISAMDSFYGASRKNAVLHKTLAVSEIEMDGAVAAMAAYAAAVKALPFPAGMIVGAAEAFGVELKAQGLAYKASQQHFADGGIVGGNSLSGDHTQVGANAREMFITESQQANLWNFIQNGSGRNQASAPAAAASGNQMVVHFSPVIPAGVDSKAMMDVLRKSSVELGKILDDVIAKNYTKGNLR